MNRLEKIAAVSVLGLTSACVTPRSELDALSLPPRGEVAINSDTEPVATEKKRSCGDVLEDLWEGTLYFGSNLIRLGG